MTRLALLFVLIQSLLCGNVAMAQQPVATRTVSQITWMEEWDASQQRWVRVSEATTSRVEAGQTATVPMQPVTIVEELAPNPAQTYPAARFALPEALPAEIAEQLDPIAQYGPFLVLGEDRAAMIGPTNEASPLAFDLMLRDFPGLRTLDMIEAPGTSNDIANLAVGRRIRAAGIATHVPRGGSVRSGAVELFLAGVERSMADSALFAVHSWLDNYGRQPQDFAPDAPENRLYLDYYVEMGMTEREARAFYAMTNSVPHASAKWLEAEEMREWVRPGPAMAQPVVVIAATVTAQPLPAPIAPLRVPAFDAESLSSSPAIVAQPMIDYRNVTQLAWLEPRLAGDHAILDS